MQSRALTQPAALAASGDARRERALGGAVFAASLLALAWLAPTLTRYLVDVDHGWQLGVARQILLGRFPYVDLVYEYGPLVGFTSALALRLSGSLVGETLVCCLGYATALWLLHRLARARISPLAGWLVPVAALVLLARFYKWYYWLFPLAVLAGCERALAQERRAGRWLACAGAAAGVGGLYRPDLAVVLPAFPLALGIGESWRAGRPPFARAAACILGVALPHAVWLAILSGVGGAAAVRDYFAVSLAGSLGHAEALATPVEGIDWSDPLSPRSGLWLGQALFAATCLGCAWLGVRGGFRRGVAGGAGERFTAAVGLLGIGLSPQAFIRADAHHLLQLLPVLLLGAGLLLARAWRSGRRAAALAYAALLLAAALGVGKKARVDLAPLASDPIEKYARLHRGVSPRASQGLGLFVRRLREASAPQGAVLALPVLPQIHFFSERPMSGLLVGYPAGVYDGEAWRMRNLAHVRRHPPAAVVLLEGSLDAGSAWRRSQPELAEYLEARLAGGETFRVGTWIVASPPREAP